MLSCLGVPFHLVQKALSPFVSVQYGLRKFKCQRGATSVGKLAIPYHAKQKTKKITFSIVFTGEKRVHKINPPFPPQN